VKKSKAAGKRLRHQHKSFAANGGAEADFFTASDGRGSMASTLQNPQGVFRQIPKENTDGESGGSGEVWLPSPPRRFPRRPGIKDFYSEV
jgi:hypothetical protein